MKLKYSFPFILLTLIFSCSPNKVSNTDDYAAFTTTNFNSNELLTNVKTWTEKLDATPNQFPYLTKRASTYTQLFNATGEISYLIMAEEDLKKAINEMYNNFGYLNQ